MYNEIIKGNIAWLIRCTTHLQVHYTFTKVYAKHSAKKKSIRKTGDV